MEPYRRTRQPRDHRDELEWQDALERIEVARRSNALELELDDLGLTELPAELASLTQLQSLVLDGNQLAKLPRFLGSLTHLRTLSLGGNYLTALPEWVENLTRLETLSLNNNRLKALPESLGNISGLRRLEVNQNELAALPKALGNLSELEALLFDNNRLTTLPEWLRSLSALRTLWLDRNQLTVLPEWLGTLHRLEGLSVGGYQLRSLPEWLGNLTELQQLWLHDNQLTVLPDSLGSLTQLQDLWVHNNQLTSLPESLGNLTQLRTLALGRNELRELPEALQNLTRLRELRIDHNRLTTLPKWLGNLTQLQDLSLDDNPLDPALLSASQQGLDALRSYLRSLTATTRRLYECKLVIVGEGAVGKTTLKRALTNTDPQPDEPTTHGITIDWSALALAHPTLPEESIQVNVWDFGGQEVYRVTHQFFFTRRSVYLLVWEPRLGVQQCQVEEWLKLIRLRVGEEAKVIIVSTHAKTGGRIARIDTEVLRRDYGSMIAGFLEVDSLERDPVTGEAYNISTLLSMIADTAMALEHMGMQLNTQWLAARDELITLGETSPRISYSELVGVCQSHGLDDSDTRTLAGLMHDLGYIIYYGDDERLRDDVVLQAEWLTKAIGFVLEDRGAQENDGVLLDSRLTSVWAEHPFEHEPHYQSEFYPFFLRLMERFDVSYRLGDHASLIAQHVPQVRPNLPWLPEEEPVSSNRRLAMVCVMDEAPPGLIPWLIVRTHEYATELAEHRLHWQKGMFLRKGQHGESLIELRERELHVFTEAIWPEYFMNHLQHTISKLITDNWPGLEDRYSFNVPCLGRASSGDACSGRFTIDALRTFLDEGDQEIRCQVCRGKQDILTMLYGFIDDEPRAQLDRIEAKVNSGLETLDSIRLELSGLESRVSNSVQAILRAIADEAKDGPRLFSLWPVTGRWDRLVNQTLHLRLWCEAEDCQHPVYEPNLGVYEFKSSRDWVRAVAPYAKFVAGILKATVPIVTPSVEFLFGKDALKGLGIEQQLSLMKTLTDRLPVEVKLRDPSRLAERVVSHDERAGLLALHALLRQEDPHHARLGLRRMTTPTGDYVWLCDTHYRQRASRVPDRFD